MSNRQTDHDESLDLAQQLEEWARLNDGVSFGDPTTVALCRAAAAMLRADEHMRLQQGPEGEEEARSVARAILEQRARLEAMPEPPGDDLELTAPSPVPLSRRHALTVESMDEDDEDGVVYEDEEEEEEEDSTPHHAEILGETEEEDDEEVEYAPDEEDDELASAVAESDEDEDELEEEEFEDEVGEYEEEDEEEEPPPPVAPTPQRAGPPSAPPRQREVAPVDPPAPPRAGPPPAPPRRPVAEQAAETPAPRQAPQSVAQRAEAAPAQAPRIGPAVPPPRRPVAEPPAVPTPQVAVPVGPGEADMPPEPQAYSATSHPRRRAEDRGQAPPVARAPESEPEPPHSPAEFDEHTLESAEALEPEEEFEPDENEDDVIPWYALPDEADETTPVARPSVAAPVDHAEEIEWDEELDEDGWQEEEQQTALAVSRQWEDRALPQDPAFDMSLVPNGGQEENLYLHEEDEEEDEPDDYASPEPRALLSIPRHETVEQSYATPDFVPDSARIKPSLQDEIARLCQLLDNMADEPDAASVPAETAYEDEWEEEPVALPPPPPTRVSKTMRGARAEPAALSRVAAAPVPAIYRKPVKEEMKRCMGILRIFSN